VLASDKQLRRAIEEKLRARRRRGPRCGVLAFFPLHWSGLLGVIDQSAGEGIGGVIDKEDMVGWRDNFKPQEAWR